MVQYSGLRFWESDAARDRALDRLQALRAGLAEDIGPNSKLDSFRLATWNIRDLGSNKFNPSPRLPETLYYIAEIISAFDLVAIQEVNANMAEFEKVMKLLGPRWTYIVTDPAGNSERLAFAYDKRKIDFRGIAGEIVLPPRRGGEPVAQFNRTPFLVSFQAGWFKFNLCAVHIFFGGDDDLEQRIREIDDIANFFAKRQKKDGETYILLGDFNIVNPEDEMMAALLGGGFRVPAALRRPTALASGNFYDQIALREKKSETEIANAGVFEWQKYVFRDTEDFAVYKSMMPKRTKTGKPAKTDLNAYKKWRTWQMSDHLPLWAEIKMDFTENYLDSLKSGRKPLAVF